MKLLLKRINWELLIIIIVAAILRFGGLTWFFPYSPHPDEWNMAAAITRLSGENKLNPHFFAYGQFPLYLSYFSATFYNLIPWIKTKSINIQEAVFFLRFWSALAGVAGVYLVFVVSKKFLTLNFALLTATLAAFAPGLIQVSHFGTTESLLSFFFLLIFLLSLQILENPTLWRFILLGITLGLSLGTKISGLTFAAPILLGLVFQLKKIFTVSPLKQKLISALKLFGKTFTFLFITFVFNVISSPYLILAFKESKQTLLYETSVASGKSPIFYTRQFYNTPPVLFQLQKIFPFALGWPIFILGTLGIIFSLFLLIKPGKNKKTTLNFKLQLLTLNFAFLTYFLSQAFLFCKWTRFMAPVFAFFPIFSGIFLSYLSNLRYLRNLIIILAVLPGILFSSVYFSPDIRFTASKWIFKNIPDGSTLLYDTGNVIDIPMAAPKLPTNSKLPRYETISFDFYNLEGDERLFSELVSFLEKTDYIIVPSRRIFANHLRLPGQFPTIAKYYRLLFSGKLGFIEIKKIVPFTSLVLNDEKAEETLTVFDHPTIRIYKKNVLLTRDQYEELF